jgi:Tol biopolymer transport system component
MSMEIASRWRGSTHGRRSWWAAAAVIVLAVAVVAFVLARSGTPAEPTIPPPAQVALVYADPAGSNPFGDREIVYRASPANQGPVRLAVGTSPLISPDGRWVAYVGGTLNHPTGLRLIASRGGLARAVAISGTPLVWSWNSRLLLALRPPGFGAAIVDTRSLRTRLLRLPEASEDFSFSPDGKMLAFMHTTGKGSDIYTVPTSGGPIRRITAGGHSRYPLWGPGGIAFERFSSSPCCHGDVWLMNATGGDARQLTHTHAGIYPAAWSADGTRMLAAYPATNNGKLYAVNVATGRARALTRFVGDLNAQGLSRNGKTVLAAIGCGELATIRGIVETIPFAGGPPTTIVRGPCRASWNA